MVHIRRIDPESSGAAADPVLERLSVEAIRRAAGGAAQMVAHFNYINRIAHGLGVDPEPLAQG